METRKPIYSTSLGEGETETNPAIEKDLRSEGIGIRTVKPAHDKLEKMTRLRYVGDEGTLRIPLDPLGPLEDTEIEIPDSVIEVTNFQFRFGHDDPDTLCLRPLCIVQHPDLQHEYVVVMYFEQRNFHLCQAYMRIMLLLFVSHLQKWNGLTRGRSDPETVSGPVELACVSHSWSDSMNPDCRKALSQVQEEGSTKKDLEFMNLLWDISKA